MALFPRFPERHFDTNNCYEGIPLASDGKGCLVSRVTQILKSTISRSSLDEISNTSFSFGHLRKVYCASLPVCLGRETL